MWAMLGGISSFLGEGTLGSFIDAEGQEEKWGWQRGKMLFDKEIMLDLQSANIFKIPHTSPVAVLIGPTTANSGEAVAVAFKGRPRTRFLGKNTMGVSTSNTRFFLKDSATLFLSTAYFVDRHNIVYENGVSPDGFISVENKQEDITLIKAIKWLLEQPRYMNK